MITQRARRLAALVLGPFGVAAAWLLWTTDSIRFGRRVMGLALDAGRRLERLTQLNLVDRDDLPLSYDQLGHIGLWMTATVLIGVASGLRSPARVVAAVAALSLATEIVQPLVAPRRLFELGDVIANFTGVLAGSTILLTLLVVSQLAGSLRRA